MPELFADPIRLPGSEETITFRRIAAGTFRRGARGKFPAEEPIHRVVIAEDFYLGEFPVTQAQFAAWTETEDYAAWFRENAEMIRETSPGKVAEPHANHFPDKPNHPAENVTWWEARGFAEWLNRSRALPPGWRADLPSEAQWEHACRSGTETAYWSGDDDADLARVGWYGGNAGGETHPVGAFGPAGANPWGLSDLHGNVWEWCLDYFDARRYRKAVEGGAGLALLEKTAVEPEGANPNHVAWAELMTRYAGEAPEVTEADREPLKRLLGMAERIVKNGDSSWDEVREGSDAALTNGTWPAALQGTARELRDIFRGLVDSATSVESPARVLRGGAWGNTASNCRAAYRFRFAPDYRDRNFGFRLAVVPGSGETSPAGAERRDGGGSDERSEEAKPRSGRGAGASPPRSGGGIFLEKSIAMKTPRTADDDEDARALSSVDGRTWWGEAVAFPFPPQPDPTVRRVVLGSLESGKELTLDDTLLAGLAAIRSHFPRLTHLHLWGISNLTAVDGLPEALEALDIRKCPALERIGPVPDTLRTLDLGGCGALRELPAGAMTGLEYIWLDGCGALTHFAPLRPALPTLQRLELHGCHFYDLDAAYCGEPEEDVADIVRGYHEALATQGHEPLAECKVVVLGNGGAGKTELVRALKGLPFDNDQNFTHAIRLWHWDGGTVDGSIPPYALFPEAGADRVDLNVWDFGGQDLYHNTHRLFLENRAVFVVVWRQPKRGADGKLQPLREKFPNDPVRPLNYWLDQVYAFNPRARVVIVRTWADDDANNPPEDWREQVREDYRGLTSRMVSCLERAQWELETLRADLLDLVKKELGGPEAVRMPRGRVAVRRQLREWQPGWDEGAPKSDGDRRLLRRHEYAALARGQFAALGLPEPDDDEIRWQIDYFHHSGAIYAPPKWIAESPSPDACPLIVDQRWAIEGIYELLFEGKDAKELLTRAGGIATVDLLESAWDRVCPVTGGPRYDREAQWVLRRFMAQCGLLVESGDRFLLPEFLPDRHMLEGLACNDRLVKETRAGGESRTYRIRHRNLGQGFGCLLVGKMAERFGAGVPLFRYGAIAEVTVGNAYAEGGERPILIRVEWHREDDDHYQGDIVATLFGPAETDESVRVLIEEILRTLPAWPPEAKFETADGHAIPTRQESFRMDPLSMPGRETPTARPKVRLGLVGLSIAGADKKYPDNEFWPNAILRGLDALPDRAFDVLFYKRDSERQTVPELVYDLVRADLLVAVIGKKYLDSKYCLVEFYEAARYHQPEGTFECPKDWPHRVWPVEMPDAGGILQRADRLPPGTDHPCQEWKKKWVDQGADYVATTSKTYRGEDTAVREAPRHHVYDYWMRYAAKSEDALGRVLAAISTKRGWSAPDSGKCPAGTDLTAWADGEVAALVTKIAETMAQLTGSLSEDLRLTRAAENSRRKWNSGMSDDAADWFDAFLAQWPDPRRVREEALQGQLPEEFAYLEAVRRYWCEKQGKG